jgi:hypothetical protein
LCPGRVDDVQGEEKQEMKRQGDKKNSKKSRKSALKHGVLGREEKKREV